MSLGKPIETPMGFEVVDCDPTSGHPAGYDLVYKCDRCGEVVPSLPDDSVSCSCRNVRLDRDAGRLSVDEPKRMRVLRRIKL